MQETHALVDFENVQPSNIELAKLLPNADVIWLFYGPNQTKRAKEVAALNALVTLVPLSRKGPNALDFQLTFHLGYVAAKHPTAYLVVVANDNGYDPMIAHAKILGFSVKRIGHKAKPPKADDSQKTKQSQPSVEPSQQAALKRITVSIPSTAKGLALKKVTKSASAKVAQTDKSKTKKLPPAKKLKQSQVLIDPALQTVLKIRKAFEKMGAKRPTKLKSFLSHLKSMIAKTETTEGLDQMVAALQDKKIVRIENNSVVYL